MRQAIEAGVAMVFLLANPNPAILAEGFGDGSKVPDKLNQEARIWLTRHYPDHSKKLKYLKDDINSTDSHSNIVNSYSTFDYDSVEQGFSENRFFDRDDKDILEISLWNIGHMTAYLIATFTQVATDRGGGVVLAKDAVERVRWLSEANDKLLSEIQARPRWQGLFED